MGIQYKKGHLVDGIKNNITLYGIGTEKIFFCLGLKLMHTTIENSVINVLESNKIDEHQILRKISVEDLKKLGTTIVVTLRHPVDKWISGYLQDLRDIMLLVNPQLAIKMEYLPKDWDLSTTDIEWLRTIHNINSAWIPDGHHSNFERFSNGSERFWSEEEQRWDYLWRAPTKRHGITLESLYKSLNGYENVIFLHMKQMNNGLFLNELATIEPLLTGIYFSTKNSTDDDYMKVNLKYIAEHQLNDLKIFTPVMMKEYLEIYTGRVSDLKQAIQFGTGISGFFSGFQEYVDRFFKTCFIYEHMVVKDHRFRIYPISGKNTKHLHESDFYK